MSSDDPRIHDALHDAQQACARACAPCSGFAMGAAVVTDSNAVIQGVLVDNDRSAWRCAPSV